MSKGTVCGCGRGYMSAHDQKCGHCRTKKERKALDAHWVGQNKLEKARQELLEKINRVR